MNFSIQDKIEPLTNTSFTFFWPQTPRRKIYPVFLPFYGCPQKCVYCAQNIQSGQKGGLPLSHILNACLHELEQQKSPIQELAFYGGTFTGLSDTDFAKCLDFSNKVRKKGLIQSCRCSTRPDFLNDARLKAMQECGFDTIELGVQSFNSKALALSERGYDKKTVLAACKKVVEHGFKLGIQLMPGLPGVTPKIFAFDLVQALEFKPAFLRLYPCLCFRNTKLANMLRDFTWAPWPLQTAVQICARAWLQAESVNTPVIRLGLHAQQGLENNLLAGPFHPAFGNLVKAAALLLIFKNLCSYASRQHNCNKEKIHLFLPSSTHGLIWGHRGELKPLWSDIISLNHLHFQKTDKIILEISAN